jgi:alpha-mannosidase
MTDASPVHVTLVPHTHWDREWYEPFSVFSERLVEMMDALLDLTADGFPHFHLDGQTAMIDDYLERRPERTAELEARVREGRLSAGPWVAQMDEFLTSGESHIRNLEMGLERARALGRPLEVGYMPDQFGHIGQMPQLLRLGGLDRAMVWRGVPEEIASTSFRWRSPDGSEVLTEYMVFGYFNGERFEQALEPAALAAALRRSVERMRPFTAGDRVVVMVGYDHAGPDATLPRRLAAAADMLEGLDVVVGSIASHLDDRRPSGGLPVWTGELRSSARAHLLPNVYSARVHQKRERGRVESLVERYAEPLAALAPGFGWPEDELRRAWTLLCWNGAHDSACGCSHDQVALDVDERFAEVRAIGEDITERALTSLGARVAGAPGVIRFNPSPFEREGVPALGYAVVPAGRDPETVEVVLEPLADGSGVLADGVPIRFLDEPDVGDLYNFCWAEDGQVPSPPGKVAIKGHEVVAAWDRLLVLARITRRSDEPFLRLEGVIRNERDDHRLRLHVGVEGAADGSLAGAPFELVERPPVGQGSALEVASATWPARHLVLAGGTAVLHEGVVEYEVAGGELVVTLLRCVGTISREVLATRPFDAGPQTPTPGAQLHGEASFALGIWPHAPSGDRGALLRGWERFGLAVAEAPAAGGGVLPRSASLAEVDLGQVQLSNVRRRGGVLEARIWNPYADRPASATIAGTVVSLGPARIETVRIEDGG